MRRNIYPFLVFIALFFDYQTLFGQLCTCSNCPVPVQDNGTFQGFLDVTVNGPDDLGLCGLQKVCFDISHTWVGDLSVTLTSPGGINYIVMGDVDNAPGGCGNMNDNVNVCITTGTANPLTKNTEYICNGPPGTCLTGDWTMPCNGVFIPFGGAVEAPNCDLNDFNVPGQPANGTWVLTINDICSQDVGTLNEWSLTFACGVVSCFVCEADGGTLNAPNVQDCAGSPNLVLSLPPGYSGTPPDPFLYGYTYVISQGGVIIALDPGPNMSAFPSGDYNVCGFSYLLSDSGQLNTLIGMNLAAAQVLFAGVMPPFCGNFSSDCVQVSIGNATPPTTIDTTVCPGACIIVGTQVVCSSTVVTLQSVFGCDSVVTVNITVAPNTSSTITKFVCVGDCTFIDGIEYCPPGPNVLMLTNTMGCDSTVIINLIEIPVQAVIMPNPVPSLGCNNASVTLDGLSSMPASFFQWIGPGGFSSTDPSITVTTPGVYHLTVFNIAVMPPCEDTTSATILAAAQGPNLQVNQTPQICVGDTFDLSTLTVVDLNNTNPVLTFHSATPASITNELPSTLVNPSTATTYYILGNSSNCTNETSVTLNVNVPPTSDFIADSLICLDSLSTITFTGTAGPGAIFNWNFDGGTVSPGNGPGPHQVQWPTSGPHIVTLSIDENGCSSSLHSVIVQVDDPLPPPAISCGVNTSFSVEFMWSNVLGASGFTVNVLSGQNGTLVGNTYLVNGLVSSEEVQIEVTALGVGACGNSSTVFSCFAADCPIVNVAIDSVGDICLDGTAGNLTLNATQSGGDGTGSYSWSGDGIIDANAGIFDPLMANIGANNVVVFYDEGICTYTANTTINVFAQPTADFTVESPICESDSSLVSYVGNAGVGGATFTWDFDGGNATPGNDAGPHKVQWNTDGTKTIRLMVEENNCLSEIFSQIVQVDTPLQQPVIHCNATTTSIEFIWEKVPNDTSYAVSVLTGPNGTMTSDTSYLVTGLMPTDTVTIEVTVGGDSACGPTSIHETCTALDCPTISVNITAVDDICLNSSILSFLLEATVIGGDSTGIGFWNGPGIVESSLGMFDPIMAGAGTHTIVFTYQETVCSYSDSISIVVFTPPTADFTIESPICEIDSSLVTYVGNAGPGSTFSWDFGGGHATPADGVGPHRVYWDSAGTKIIRLIVVENNCATEVAFEGTVEVEVPLPKPVIECNATTTSIEFIWGTIPNATSYVVSVLTGPNGTSTSDTSYLVTGLMPTESATIEVTVEGNSTCGQSFIQQTCTSLECPIISLNITPVNDLCLTSSILAFSLEATVNGGDGTGTGFWNGPGVVESSLGMFDPIMAGVGTHSIVYNFEEGVCSYSDSISINIFTPPTADFTVESPICESDSSLVNYIGNAGTEATFSWGFDGGNASPGIGPGPHWVHWDSAGTKTIKLIVEENNCATEVAFETMVEVEAPLPQPIIQCNSTTATVEFTWSLVPGATSYIPTILGSAVGTQTSDTTYFVTGLNPGEEVVLQVEASGLSACGVSSASFSCNAQNCPDITIDLIPLPDFCLGNVFVPSMLTATVTGGSGTGTGIWEGPGIIDSINGTFDPAIVGAGSHLITFTYAEDNCSYTETMTFVVNENPVASFNVTSPVCLGEASQVTFSGTPTAEVFNWDFDGGTANPGSGVGPHGVIWSSGGAKTISLSVEENGCTSQISTATVEVEEPLPLPVINCSSTLESIEFTWQTVPGASSYMVSSISGPAGQQVSPTSYVVSGLNPDEAVTIEVEAVGTGICPNPISQQSCSTLPCPSVSIAIAAVSPICLTPLAQEVALEATVTGGSGNGTVSWEGPGISDPTSNLFNPVAAGVGIHLIKVTYAENSNCLYSQNLSIQVEAPPIADAGKDQTLTCETINSPFLLGGSGTSAGSGILINWTADFGAFPGDSTILNPEINQPGTYTLTVTNSDLGCSSSDVVVIDAEIETPVPEIVISPVSCFGEGDGAIDVISVIGGLGPYLFSLNDNPFSTFGNFAFLSPNTYKLTVQDANGCENVLFIDLRQPQELNVNLIAFSEGNNIIRLGDSILLNALVSIPEDSIDIIRWDPADSSILSCLNCLQPFAKPIQQTTFTVTVESNGCMDSDKLTVLVKKDRPVFVPNVFSPNGDGQNDRFMIFAGPQITRVKSFLVFNRWGETVYQFLDFQPDNRIGWDGTFRGQQLDPAVFVWFAEIEFVDGKTELFKGDVTLVK